MIESLQINNFRCYGRLALNGLDRINIIVGRNASGKTSFLEGLFLAGGNSPELALRAKAWRGLPQLAIANIKSSYEDLWRDLFYQFNHKNEISISLSGSSLDTRLLRISYRPDQGELIPISEDARVVDTAPIVPIIFEWTDAQKNTYSARPQITGTKMSIAGKGEAATMPIAFYSSSHVASAEENANYFSSFSIKNQESVIVDCIKSEFPFIQSMSVEARSQGPGIYASVAHLAEKIPINFLSGGVHKLLSLLLGIANQPGGVVLIDEIENGFYYDRMPSIWKLLLRFAKEYDVQIFASTHSMECLKAAAECANESVREFRLLRTEKDNGSATIKLFSGEQFRSAISQSTEIR